MSGNNVTIFFDGLMVFMKEGSAYQVRLLTNVPDHEVSLKAYKTDSDGKKTLYDQRLFSNDEIRGLEHLWLFVTSPPGGPTPSPVTILDPNGFKGRVINLKQEFVDLSGKPGSPQDKILKPTVHLQNGELSAGSPRKSDSYLVNYDIVRTIHDAFNKIADKDRREKAADNFKKKLTDNEPMKRGRLAEYIQLSFSLMPGQSLRLEGGDPNGPTGNQILRAVVPKVGETYEIYFRNLPPGHEHDAHHTWAGETYHFIHYYDAFGIPLDKARVIVEDEPVRLGPYPDPPCFSGVYNLFDKD